MKTFTQFMSFYSARKVNGRWCVIDSEGEPELECESRRQAEEMASDLNDSLFKQHGVAFVSLEAVRALARYHACDCVLTVHRGYNDFQLANQYMVIHLADENMLYDRYSIIDERFADGFQLPSPARIAAMHAQLRKGPVYTAPFIPPRNEW